MEHPAPTLEDSIRQALSAATDPTPMKEALRLLELPDELWSYEDLQFSESTRDALIRLDYPMVFAMRLAARHRRAARRLLASETSTPHLLVIAAAQRLLGGAA